VEDAVAHVPLNMDSRRCRSVILEVDCPSSIEKIRGDWLVMWGLFDMKCCFDGYHESERALTLTFLIRTNE
jgi:hypothetical protein